MMRSMRGESFRNIICHSCSYEMVAKFEVLVFERVKKRLRNKKVAKTGKKLYAKIIPAAGKTLTD